MTLGQGILGPLIIVQIRDLFILDRLRQGNFVIFSESRLGKIPHKLPILAAHVYHLLFLTALPGLPCQNSLTSTYMMQLIVLNPKLKFVLQSDEKNLRFARFLTFSANLTKKQPKVINQTCLAILSLFTTIYFMFLVDQLTK